MSSMLPRGSRTVCSVLIALAVVLPAQPAGGRPGPSVRVGGAPLQLVSGHGSLWVLTCDRGCSGEARSSLGRIVRIDPRAARVTASINVARPQQIAVGTDGVYGLDFWHGDVYRLDPATLHVTARLHLVLPFSVGGHDNAFLPETISLGAGSVWVTTNRGAIARIDPRSLRLVKLVRLAPAGLDGVSADRTSAWAAIELGGVARLDVHTYRVVAEVPIRADGRMLSVGQTFVVEGNVLAVGDLTEDNAVTNTMALARVSPRDLRLEGVTLLPGPRLCLAVSGGVLWAARVGGSSVQRIDPATGAVSGTVRGRVGVAIAVSSGSVWTITRTGIVRRVGGA
jgi:streptogramin lyase